MARSRTRDQRERQKVCDSLVSLIKLERKKTWPKEVTNLVVAGFLYMCFCLFSD